MSITNKTRKLLWLSSGNQCAICHCRLVEDCSVSDDPSIVGDECHIVSGQMNGPRYDSSFPSDKVDQYDNLLILCKVHHKMIDDQPGEYTVNKLKEIKMKHEKHVSEQHSKVPKSDDKKYDGEQKYLVRLLSGKDELSIVANIFQFGFFNDDPRDEEELDFISTLIQTIQEYGEMYDCFDASEILRIEFSLTRLLEEAEKRGLWVFGMQDQVEPVFAGLKNQLWTTGLIYVLHENNPTIIKLGMEKRET